MPSSASSDYRWGVFVGGVLLGSTVAACSAYLMLKYGPRYLDEPTTARALARKRSTRTGSPGPRHHHPGRRSTQYNGDATTTPSLRRLDTEEYYGGSPSAHESDLPNGANGDYEPLPVVAQRSRSLQLPPPEQPIISPAAGAPQPRKALFVPRSPSPLPTYREGVTDAEYGTEAELHTDVPSQSNLGGIERRDTYSETEAHIMLQGGSSGLGGVGGSSRSTVLYNTGPADRTNRAVHEAIRHVGSVRDMKYGSTPIQQGGGSSHLGNTPLGGGGASQVIYSPLYAGEVDRSPSLHHTQGHSPSGHTSTPGTNGPVSNTPHHHSHHPVAVGGNILSSGGLVYGAQPVGTSSAAAHAHAKTTADVLATEGRIIEDAAQHDQYSKIITPDMPLTEESEEVCYMLQRALDLRQKWLFKPYLGPVQLAYEPEATTTREILGDPFEWVPVEPLPYKYAMVDGVYKVWTGEEENQQELFSAPGTASEFFRDMLWLLKVSSAGHVRSFTHQRLQLLEQKFNLHVMLNADKEFLAQKSAPHRDFYNVRKVDTHVHHSACMHQKHLLRFIKSKLKKEADEVVIFRDGKYLTLKEVFESLNMTAYDLSVDTLDVHADKNIFHRFDKFNLKYNPFGQSRLREVFIKQDNLIHGRFLAELTREVFVDLEASKYQHVEYRISVYGRKPVEWDMLAAWVVQNRLFSSNNMWMIQIPRLYNVYKEQGIIENFQQLLDNIFQPLFEVTMDPNSHPMLHLFLQQVSGFDLVDDESKPERRPVKEMPSPQNWNTKHNPAYAYYAYYMYANLYVLNRLRESRGYTTFTLRPHSGEAGDVDHLATTFLLAESIAHGINLRRSPSLQYLYYLGQIGLCMSPLSNNSLFLDFQRNPFPQFFARGLSVSISTDDPLQIHLTREPLVEEYSVAAQVWKLSATDLCEIARNSVLHSGFPHRCKMHWVHTEYWKMGPEGNNIQKTNVPSLRMCFRKDCYVEEIGLLNGGAGAHSGRLMAKEIALHNSTDGV